MTFSKPVSKAQFAEILGISLRTLERWINRLIQLEPIPGYDKQAKFLMPSVANILTERLQLTSNGVI